ncbi:MAG: EAL domain-containing protein [Gemmatimonadetes bacterium]|nr:MAG: EAL domain-containing protein [Gemmatimonadota bacterium]
MDIFVARQPIFDARRRVVGYELLYRDGSGATEAGEYDPTRMSSQVIVDAVLGLGLMSLASGRSVFLNFNREMLLSGVADVLDPDRVVIEVLETVEPDEEVVAACRALTERGFTLALDDFVYTPAWEPLLELAGVVKIDVLSAGEHLDELVERVRPFGVELLAEKVETAAVHRRCRELGFDYFQGFYYFRPETVRGKDLSAQTVAVIRLLNLIRDPRATEATILEAFRSDPGLSYKLLRMVNSAALGGRGVASLGHALRLLGRDPLYRWLSLLLISGRDVRSGERQELLRSAVLRGRMCELLGDVLRRGSRSRDVPQPDALFLVGLFSQLDVLLSVPMDDVLSQIHLAQDLRDALLARAGEAGVLLAAVEAYQRAEWQTARRLLDEVGVDADVLPDLYVDALAWAGNRLALYTEEEDDDAAVRSA